MKRVHRAMVRLRNRCITQSFYQWQARVDEKKTKVGRLQRLARRMLSGQFCQWAGAALTTHLVCLSDTVLPQQPCFMPWQFIDLFHEVETLLPGMLLQFNAAVLAL